MWLLLILLLEMLLLNLDGLSRRIFDASLAHFLFLMVRLNSVGVVGLKRDLLVHCLSRR